MANNRSQDRPDCMAVNPYMRMTKINSLLVIIQIIIRQKLMNSFWLSK